MAEEPENSEPIPKNDQNLLDRLRSNPIIASIIVGFLVASSMTVLGEKVFSIYRDASKLETDAKIERHLTDIHALERDYGSLKTKYNEIELENKRLLELRGTSVSDKDSIISKMTEDLKTRNSKIDILQREVDRLKIKTDRLESFSSDDEQAKQKLLNEIEDLQKQLDDHDPKRLNYVFELKKIIVAHDGYEKNDGTWDFNLRIADTERNFKSKNFDYITEPEREFDLIIEKSLLESEEIEIRIDGKGNLNNRLVKGTQKIVVPKLSKDVYKLSIPVLSDYNINNNLRLGAFIFILEVKQSN